MNATSVLPQFVRAALAQLEPAACVDQIVEHAAARGDSIANPGIRPTAGGRIDHLVRASLTQEVQVLLFAAAGDDPGSVVIFPVGSCGVARSRP